MKTQEMHDRLLENLIKITGRDAADLVPPIHEAGVAAHAAGDGAVNEVRAQFFAGVAERLGVPVEEISKHADNLKDDWRQALIDIVESTGQDKETVRLALHEVGNEYMDEYKEAVAANHEGFVVRAAEKLGVDRSVIEKAFIFD